MAKRKVEKRYCAVFAKGFRSEFEKLSGVHQKMVMNKVSKMEENPFYPSLRTKKMKGGSGNYESSINMDIRVLWRFDDDNSTIIMLLDVGHHDILKKY